MSERDCRNDCIESLQFPRRPGTNSPAKDGEDCSCCASNAHVSADNRPALTHFNYRIGTYTSIREWLLQRINQSASLQSWTYREPDDPAIALLEGAAILGDILTFYQDLYANEAFLRTAVWRESIADLVRLLGYRLSPAIGGNATFAFEIKKDEAVRIPAGFPVKATLEEIDAPAEFETKEEITAYPWLSRFNLFRPLERGKITASSNEFYIAAPGQALTPIEIKAGDRLMIGESDKKRLNQPTRLNNAEIVIVDSIRELHGTKIFKIKGKLKRKTQIDRLAAYKLGRVFHHFGYNGPTSTVLASNPVITTSTVDNSGKTTVTTTISTSSVPDMRKINDATNSTSLIAPTLFQTHFPIDAEVQDLPVKTPVIVQGTFYYDTAEPAELTLVRTIARIAPVLMTWGALTGMVSNLKLRRSLSSSVGNKDHLNIRTVLFHEVVSPLFAVKRAQTETTAQAGDELNFYGTAEQVETLKDRRIMIEKSGKILSVVSVPKIRKATPTPRLYPIRVSEAVDYADFPNETPSVAIFGNLVDADEGKTLPEAVLGSGDNTQSFQSFKVPKLPLTYHLDAASTPPETPELRIYVNGFLWRQVESFFDRAPDEKIYIVREDTENNSWVQFGDGKNGAKLPSGVNNVSAIYRIGAGAHGALKAETKVQAGAKLKNLDKIQMPAPAVGGTRRESGENAKDAAPGKIQSLGRMVSLRDFETESAALPGVVLTSAAWRLINDVPLVAVTVLMETGRSGEIDSIQQILNAYNSLRGASRFEIKVVPGSRRYVHIIAEYALDPAYRADLVEPEIRKNLGVNFGKPTNEENRSGLFSLRKRRFGKREYASTIEGTIKNTPGVMSARVTAMSVLPESDNPDSIVIPATDGIVEIVPCDGAHVLSLYDKHLILKKIT